MPSFDQAEPVEPAEAPGRLANWVHAHRLRVVAWGVMLVAALGIVAGHVADRAWLRGSLEPELAAAWAELRERRPADEGYQFRADIVVSRQSGLVGPAVAAINFYQRLDPRRPAESPATPPATPTAASPGTPPEGMVMFTYQYVREGGRWIQIGSGGCTSEACEIEVNRAFAGDASEVSRLLTSLSGR